MTCVGDTKSGNEFNTNNGYRKFEKLWSLIQEIK